MVKKYSTLTRNIAVDLDTHEKVQRMAKAAKLSMGEYLHDCIKFMDKTGLSPQDIENIMLQDIKYIKDTVTEIKETLDKNTGKKG